MLKTTTAESIGDPWMMPRRWIDGGEEGASEEKHSGGREEETDWQFFHFINALLIPYNWSEIQKYVLRGTRNPLIFVEALQA